MPVREELEAIPEILERAVPSLPRRPSRRGRVAGRLARPNSAQALACAAASCGGGRREVEQGDRGAAGGATAQACKLSPDPRSIDMERRAQSLAWHKTADKILDGLASYCQRITDSNH